MANDKWHDREREGGVPGDDEAGDTGPVSEADTTGEEGAGRGPFGFLHGGSGFQEGHGNEGYGSENYGGQNYMDQNEYGRQTYGVEGGPWTGGAEEGPVASDEDEEGGR